MSGITTEIQHTYLIGKKILFFILLTVISISYLSSAIEPLLSSPPEAKIEEPFSAVIETEHSETNYDIKIFVKNEAAEIISEIDNNGWKNPYYYIKEAFPSKTEFKIRVLREYGEKNICLRMRESGKQTFEESCNSIIIIESNNKDTLGEEINSSEDKIKSSEKEIEKQLEEVFKEERNIEAPQVQNSIKTQAEKILLNTQAKEAPLREFTTKENSKRRLILYVFIGFCIIIIILLALKRL